MTDGAKRVKVRSATLADAPRLAELSGMLGYPLTSGVMADRLERLLSRPADAVLVAQSSTGEVVGWVHGSEQELLESGRRCEILGLVVDESHRRAGIGRDLLQSIELWAGSRGIEYMTVRSNLLRLESHPFYERFGYRRTKTQHVYRKDLETAGRLKKKALR